VPLIVYVEIIELPALLLLGFWFVMQLFGAGAGAIASSGDSGGIAFMAHIAGFATGAAAVVAFGKRRMEWELEK
jgi:hypothetical protein